MVSITLCRHSIVSTSSLLRRTLAFGRASSRISREDHSTLFEPSPISQVFSPRSSDQHTQKDSKTHLFHTDWLELKAFDACDQEINEVSMEFSHSQWELRTISQAISIQYILENVVLDFFVIYFLFFTKLESISIGLEMYKSSIVWAYRSKPSIIHETITKGNYHGTNTWCGTYSCDICWTIWSFPQR